VATGISFSPPLETTTFVQSQPGQPLGTPCSPAPTLPTEVTATATIAPVNGNVPDSVFIDIDTDHFHHVPMAPISPGSDTYVGTGPVTDGTEVFVANKINFLANIGISWQGQSMDLRQPGPEPGFPGVVDACA
jgi:hypothetical protein